MSCSCGSSQAFTRTATSQIKGTSQNAIRLLLNFDECSSCGRVGREILFANGEMVTLGADARNKYCEAIESGLFEFSCNNTFKTIETSNAADTETHSTGELTLTSLRCVKEPSLPHIDRELVISHPYKLHLIYLTGNSEKLATILTIDQIQADKRIIDIPVFGQHFESEDKLEAMFDCNRWLKTHFAAALSCDPSEIQIAGTDAFPRAKFIELSTGENLAQNKPIAKKSPAQHSNEASEATEATEATPKTEECFDEEAFLQHFELVNQEVGTGDQMALF